MQLPLAITMGDACGIGPEIIASAFLRGALPGGFAVGVVEVLRRAAALVSASDHTLLPVATLSKVYTNDSNHFSTRFFFLQ